MLTEAIHNEALQAADQATANYIAQNGENYPCGFAWVHATIKGNTKLGKSFIAQGFDKSYTGGYRLWNPGKSFTQDMYAKEAGAQAYVDTIKRYIPDAPIYVNTRLD